MEGADRPLRMRYLRSVSYQLCLLQLVPLIMASRSDVSVVKLTQYV